MTGTMTKSAILELLREEESYRNLVADWLLTHAYAMEHRLDAATIEEVLIDTQSEGRVRGYLSPPNGNMPGDAHWYAIEIEKLISPVVGGIVNQAWRDAALLMRSEVWRCDQDPSWDPCRKRLALEYSQAFEAYAAGSGDPHMRIKKQREREEAARVETEE